MNKIYLIILIIFCFFYFTSCQTIKPIHRNFCEKLDEKEQIECLSDMEIDQ